MAVFPSPAQGAISRTSCNFSRDMLSLAAASLSYSGVARPVVQQRSAVARMGVSDLVGASEEISGKVWDPLNLSEKMDEGNLNLVRAAELKHCRVAMLATVGWAWTATGTHFEGMLSPSAGVSFAALAALDPITAASKVPGAGIWQMIAAIGTVEVYWENKYPSYKCGGNYGVPACTTDPEKFKELQLAELKNGAPLPPSPAPTSLVLHPCHPGHVPTLTCITATCDAGRLAMIGIISFATAVAIPGSVPFYPF
tara:strand:- start:230 stop:991 length:762 start_codon:yes stop_codon:yes gene_type:complete